MTKKMRTVDTESVARKLKGIYCAECSAVLKSQCSACWVNDVLELLEGNAVDAVEVVHGRWEFGELDILGQPVHCTVCGWGTDTSNREMWLEYPGHKYCGNCGAKMDGG